MSSAKKFAANKATDSVAGLRFLVVDDHKFSRHITIEALKWLDATKIDEAQDASEAIALLQGAASMDRKSLASNATAKRLELSDDRLFGQGKFDCVITDFNMSPLNGLHLLKAIRTGDAKCARHTGADADRFFRRLHHRVGAQPRRQRLRPQADLAHRLQREAQPRAHAAGRAAARGGVSRRRDSGMRRPEQFSQRLGKRSGKGNRRRRRFDRRG